MNKVILMGRLTRDPEVRYSAGENSLAIARYTLAVDRRFKRDGEATADFINCVSFGRTAEFAEKYYRQGLKIVVSGRIQTGSYTNREGQKVYTTEVVVEEQEFAESKAASDNYQGGSSYQNNNYGGGYNNNSAPAAPAGGSSVSADGFMNIPDGIDEELPFN
ncbi:MAG: single-stranded DNA-binding protein [Oliverpabstia sp.]